MSISTSIYPSIYPSIYIHIHRYMYQTSMANTPSPTTAGKARTQRSRLRPAASTAADAERSEGARRRSGRARRWRTTSVEKVPLW